MVCCIGATRVVHERTPKSKNDATFKELSRLGIADGHNIIKGKQLFIPHYELGDLFGGCLSKGIIVVSPSYVPLFYGWDTAGAQDSFWIKVPKTCE